jgi:hypothetical protein
MNPIELAAQLYVIERIAGAVIGLIVLGGFCIHAVVGRPKNR